MKAVYWHSLLLQGVPQQVQPPLQGIPGCGRRRFEPGGEQPPVPSDVHLDVPQRFRVEPESYFHPAFR
jgi:hypothetical protein